MNIPDKLNVIRQQLRMAKDLSGQAKEAFEKVEGGSETASSLLGAVSKDVYEASLNNRPWALTAAGRRAEETLDEVKAHHDQVVSDFDGLIELNPTLGEALYTARSEAESLPLPTNVTWHLRNVIDSAQREEGYATQSVKEIDKSLFGVESELDSARENATEVGTSPRRPGSSYGGGYGNGWGRNHEGRRRHHGGHSDFRQRIQARIQERLSKGRALDETASKLDNPYQDIDRSADRGSRHQDSVAEYVDQAMYFVDNLEKEYANRPAPVAPPVAKPRPAPSPTAPIPIFEPPVAAQPQPAPKPEGFFRKPWRSS